MKIIVFNWFIAVWFAALSFSNLAAFTPSGGRNAHPSEFPGYVRIVGLNSKKKQMQCSAVKIAPKTYLTAAHCIESPLFNKGARLKFVNLGDRVVKVISKSTAPTSIIANDPNTGWRHEQDLGVFTTDRELPEIKTADISLITGKLKVKWGDVFRMVGKRDVEASVYGYADTNYSSWDPFCVNTRNRLEQGSIRPGDSGGPLYLVRDGRLYLAGITIEYVEETRTYKDQYGRKVGSKVNSIQRFTRLDKGCQSLADKWVLDKLKNQPRPTTLVHADKGRLSLFKPLLNREKQARKALLRR